MAWKHFQIRTDLQSCTRFIIISPGQVIDFGHPDCVTVAQISTTTAPSRPANAIRATLPSCASLVLVDTDKDLEVINGVCLDSVGAVMNTPVNIPLEGIGNGTYWLYATDNSANLSEPEAFTVMGVGIDNRNSEKLRICPNPIYTLITIETFISDPIYIEVTSPNGNLLLCKEKEVTTHQRDLSSFESGVYFITFRSKDFVTTRKIVKL